MRKHVLSIKVSITLMVALVLGMALATLTPSSIYAASLTKHNSRTSLNAASGCTSQNALVIVYYSGGEWDDCSYGYQHPSLGGVTELETLGNPSEEVWFKWYNGPVGKYCDQAGDYAHWYPPAGITNITQVDYGDGYNPNPDQCS